MMAHDKRVMEQRSRKSRERRPLPPLDTAAVERLALRYVERFATTRGRLADYLGRKLRERGLAEGAPAPDLAGLADRLAALGYIDDLAFGTARASSMARRGLGARRVNAALHQAGLDEEDRSAISPMVIEAAAEAALTYARRKRIGPFAAGVADRPLREKQLAAMIRAGHSFTVSRKIVALSPGEEWQES